MAKRTIRYVTQMNGAEPGISMVDNSRRIKQAAKAVKAYASYDPHDLQSSIVDLVTDLLHLAEFKQLSVGDILLTVKGHLEAERI